MDYTCVDTMCRHLSRCRYRKVGGDVCKGGSESVYGATDTPCCSNGKYAISWLIAPGRTFRYNSGGYDKLIYSDVMLT